MIAPRTLRPVAVQVKRQVAQVKHVSAPLKGLSLNSKLVPGDPLSATVLKNFVADDDRISSRAGYVHVITDPALRPIEALIPFYGQPQRLAAATNHTLISTSDGTLLADGFTSNDWHWTSFSNLGEQDFVVMVNGSDGVWSWNGGLTRNPGIVPVTVLDNLNPARCTVSPADIGKFINGMTVVIAGAAGDLAFVNGPHVINNVGVAPWSNSFDLPGVDASVAAAPQLGSVTATPPGSVAKETVTAPAAATWIVPDQFQLVLSHMNRLWFADSTNLAVYYLELQQKSGELKGYLPLNAIFRRGGFIKAMYTWALEGGVSLANQLVIFTSNGEAAIYAGTDPGPQGDMQLRGVFRFDTPMSKQGVVNFGGELYVLTATGVVPMSTMLRAETEQLGQVDKNIMSLFMAASTKYRDRPGWQLLMNPSSARLICNVPAGASNRYGQMIRHMPRPVWSQWVDVPSRCWGWIDPYLYFGDDRGNVFRMHPQYRNDNGQPIKVDVQLAWSQYGTPALKHFKMIQPYMITDGDPRPMVEVKVDYDYSEPNNQPDVTFAEPGAIWDEAPWNDSFWASGEDRAVKLWNGVAAIGRVGGPRLTALIDGCNFAVSGFDVIFETGAVLG
jgi:hypothetical protein